MSSISSQICRYYLIGACVFGDRCQRSHKGDLKKANASNSHNDDSPVDNRIARSDKRSASEGENEDVQENVRRHVSDPIPSEVDEEHVESDVQDSGPSRGVILNPPSHINVDEENADKTCIFFLEGACRNGSDCNFSHSISKDTETASGSRVKRPNLSKSYLCSSFFIPDYVAHRIPHCSKVLRLVTREGLQTLPSGALSALPTRE
jgi:hypothetical protein